MTIRAPKPEDAAAVAALYNHYVLHSTASFETEPLDAEQMRSRLESATARLVCEREGAIVGFGYTHDWKERAAYRHTQEVTVYVAPDSTGLGIGRRLVERLVAELGEGRPGSLDLIRSPLGEPAALLSREAVVAAGGFGMRPLRGIPRCRRRMLWEPLLAAPRSGGRMPGRLRGLAVASLAAAFAAAAAAGWWTSAAALATLALVWAGGECAARLAGGTAFSAPGGLTAWRRLFGHY